MKKLSIIYGLALVLALGARPSLAAQFQLDFYGGDTSYVKGDFETSITIREGDTIYADIWVTDIAGGQLVGTIDTELLWNSDEVEVVSIDNSFLVLPTGIWNAAPHVQLNGDAYFLEVILFSGGNPGPDIQMQTIEFRCIAVGEDLIKITSNGIEEWFDENSVAIIPYPDELEVTVRQIECQEDAECDDENVCTDDSCDMDTKECVFDPVEDGTSCDEDGIYCNGTDTCQGGNCVAGAIPCPDDEDSCTDDCVEATQECYVCNATDPTHYCCEEGVSPVCENASVCAITIHHFYVDGTGGDNSIGDGSEESPWKTITHALNTIPTSITLDENNNATVHVAASIYDRTMGGGDAETFPIVMKEYISLFGDGYEETIIDAGGDAYPINNVIMFRQEDYIQNVTLSGFTIMGGNAFGGGGIMINWANPVISNCNITGNTAYGMNGGGIYLKRSNPIISNCIIAGNQAPAQRGGGISCGNLSHPIITNCTIVNNLSGSLEWEGGGGLFAGDYSNPTITNCIFWGNEGDDPTTPEDESQILAREGSGIVVNYSCIDGGWSGSGTGNIISDPGFLGSDDYHLTYTSSCIDAADGDAAPATDIDGEERWNDLITDDTGTGYHTYYDIGAYEYRGDSDRDGILDDGDGSLTIGDNPCTDDPPVNCDDNCITTPNGLEGGTCLFEGEPCMIDVECGEFGPCNINQEDNDGDGQGDVCDPDDDNDGIPDEVEREGDPDPDDDDIPNWFDTDSDGDTVSDAEEAGDDPNNPVDTDEDGDPDYLDTDSDDDTILDGVDNCRLIPNFDQEDADEDGIGNVCDICPNDPENDIDNDGICGDVDNCPSHPNGPDGGTCKCGSKEGDPCMSDGDCGACGFCSMDQEDTDNDGLGDACDPSPYADTCQSYCNLCEYCIELQNAGRNLDYDACVALTSQGQSACEAAECYWNTQGLPAPGVCIVDICLADNDFSTRITGGDLSVLKKELGRMDCPCDPSGDLCEKYDDLYDCCVDLGNAGRNLDYDACVALTSQGQSACEAAGCYWNTQGLPAPGVCTVDICLADNDFSGRITGADLSVFKKELGRVDCPPFP